MNSPQLFNIAGAVRAIVRFACVSVYALVLMVFLRDYASVEWAMYRFSYADPGLLEIYCLLAFLFLTAVFIPPKIDAPSSLLLIFVYLLVIIPTGVCSIGLASLRSVEPYQLLVATGLPFAVACIINSKTPRDGDMPTRRPHEVFLPVFAGISALLIVFLFYRYREIMSFASLDTLYEQREKGAASSLVEGYIQTYSQYVLSTGLVAFGLFKKNIWIVGLGFFGSLTNFAVTAEKSGIIYPVFIFILYLMLSAKNQMFRSMNFLCMSLSLVLFLALITYKIFFISEFIAWYLGMRTIMTPGAFVIHYLDFFSQRGFTYFSHIRGLDVILGVPSQFINDPRWPGIGLIIGEDFFGMDRLNANANFVASDGAASLGLIGIPLAILGFGFLLKVFDRASQGIGDLALLLLLPIALTLSNGSMFTIFTSFGGLFWILVFKFFFVEDSRHPQVAVEAGGRELVPNRLPG